MFVAGDGFATTSASMYSKIADTMPRNTPGSLTADVYLDIVAHVC
jgi:hypothetical protein